MPTPPPREPTHAHGSFVGAGSIEDVLPTAEAPPPARPSEEELARFEDRVETAEVARDFGPIDPDVATVDLRGQVLAQDGSAVETTPYHTVLPVPGQVLQQETVPPPGPPGSSAPGESTDAFPTVLPVPGAKAPDVLEPGVTVEGVTIGARLRNEPLGTVFAAEHPHHPDCEVLALSEAAGALLGPAFLHSARLRASLDPNDLRLPHALAVGSKPTPWVASRPKTGTPLMDLLEGDPVRLARLVADAAEALGVVHALHVWHGDLTPDDVTVVDGEVRLSGFGRSAVRLDAQGVRRPFQGGPSSGDAAFLAPEVAEGSDTSPAADIYALGAFLWTGLTGHPPYTGTPKEIRAGLTAGPPARPVDAPDAGFEGALFEIAERCLKRRAAERFRDANDLALALQETLARHGRRWLRWVLALLVIGAVAAAVVALR